MLRRAGGEGLAEAIDLDALARELEEVHAQARRLS
jgi:hypothetical protein